MDSFQLFLLFIVIFFSFQPSISDENCRIQCGSKTIRFPFRLTDQPDHCSYAGFKLSCEVGEGQGVRPILTLPYAGNFSVYEIDYPQQVLQIDYSEGCIPRILLLHHGLNLSGSPFASAVTRNYTFFNCSSHAPMLEYPRVTKIQCLSGLNFYVVATRTDSYIPPTTLCSEIAKVLVPIPPIDWLLDLNYGVILGWTQPDCRWCESQRGTCLLKNVFADLDVGCSGAVNSGLSRSAKYAILFGAATPIVCLLAIISCHRIEFIERQNHPSPEILMSVTLPRLTSAASGLDRRIIDTYPTTLLGQSRRLPNPNDNTCSVCLCEYQANETLRTIPNCNHYFHIDCIDQWLELNATCPICRDKFEKSAASVTATLSSSRPVVRLML